MKKKFCFISFVLFFIIFTLGGCAPTHEQQIQQRINEYADTMYLVFWGNQYKEAELPKKLVSTRNEFNEHYMDRIHKVIFVTDSFTAINLTKQSIMTFSEMMGNGFSIYFYDYNKSVIDAFTQKFEVKTNNLDNGSNYFCRLQSVEGTIISSIEYSSVKANPVSSKLILTTVLERMTH